MKHTKIMLVIISTLLLTFSIVGLIVYLLSDLSYKQSLCHGTTVLLMMLIGWIPSVIVAVDYNEYLEK